MENQLTTDYIYHCCQTFYALSHIPVRLEAGHSSLFHFPQVEAAAFWSPEMIPDGLFKQHTKSGSRRMPILYSESQLYMIAALPIHTDKGSCCLSAGPCFFERPQPAALKKTRLGQIHDLKAAAALIPVYSLDYFCTALQCLYQALFHLNLSIEDMLKANVNTVPELIERRAEKIRFHQRENVHFHTPYAFELEQQDIIRRGQLSKIHEMLDKLQTGTPGILSKNPLRHSKNLLIAAVTLFTRAAIQGGLPEEAAYTMSDSFIQSCEECNDIQSVEALENKAFYDFTAAVASLSKPHYSKPVASAVKEINRRLHERIVLSEVAGAARLSPCYFTRLFKKETGLSFSQYIQQQKINAAKNMLRYSDYSLQQISDYLAFSSESYFIKIFKKFESVTPAIYRQKNTKFS